MRTIRITITSPETAHVVFREVQARPLALKDKLAALYQKIRLHCKAKQKP